MSYTAESSNALLEHGLRWLSLVLPLIVVYQYISTRAILGCANRSETAKTCVIIIARELLPGQALTSGDQSGKSQKLKRGTLNLIMGGLILIRSDPKLTALLSLLNQINDFILQSEGLIVGSGSHNNPIAP